MKWEDTRKKDKTNKIEVLKLSMKFGYESSVGIQAFNVGQQFQGTCLSFEHVPYRHPTGILKHE